jgi:hypothetical protein
MGNNITHVASKVGTMNGKVSRTMRGKNTDDI